MRLVLPALLAAVPYCYAASPEFNAIMPRGGQTGTTAPVSLLGNRLDDTEEIVSYSPQIKVVDFKVESATVIKAGFMIDPACPPGEHLFRVRTKSGLSYARNFWVGAYPSTEEKEPNNQFVEAQAIHTSSTLTGIAKNEDVDYFKIEAKKGERVSVEVEGIRLGSSFWDPYLAILDSKKFELATCDDSALLVQDPHASITIPEDGTYYIEVRDTSYAGNDSAHYRVHVGAFPRPTTLFPPGGKAGTATEVTFLGDIGGPIKQNITIPETQSQELPLFATLNGVSAPSPNIFRVSPLENVLEAGANNNHAEAKASQTASAVPIAFNGIIEAPNDEDWFRFTAKKDQKLDFQVLARALRSPLDPVLELFNADGGALNGNDDNGPLPDSRIAGFTIPADGDYYLRIRDQLGRGAADFVYRVEVSPPTASLKAYLTRIDRVDSQLRQLIPLPRGGRYASLVNVDRTNCGGPVTWDTAALPAGVSVEFDPLPDGITQQALLFTAAPDAPLAAALARLTPKTAVPDQSYPARFVQNIEFVQGEPNQTPYVTSVQSTVPLAVTDEAPFALEIVKPTVPLVQSGTMDLKIKATRKEGFKAPITLRLMWNPPGISSPGTVDIPEGQTEATYQLTANGDAPAKTWRLTVLGETGINGGTIFNASPFTEVSIAPPYLTMKMEMGATEVGKPGEIFCTLEVAKTFTGSAKVNLYGLPAKVTTIEKEFTAADKEIRFPVTTAADSPTGKHQNLFCQAIIMENGSPVPHTIGQGGVFRVDPPPPAPAVPPPAAPELATAATPPPPPAAKPLSRLEQLRQQQASK